MLYGPPGCGKTLIARATAGESDARFLSINPEDIIDRYTGEAEKRLHMLFDEARSDTPAIIFFDDFDVLAFRRAGLPPEAAPALIAAFASELDGTQRNNAGLLIIMSTNAPWVLDQALFRAGRFQRVLFVPPPALEARKKILIGAVSNIPRRRQGGLRPNRAKVCRPSQAPISAPLPIGSATILSQERWPGPPTLRSQLRFLRKGLEFSAHPPSIGSASPKRK